MTSDKYNVFRNQLNALPGQIIEFPELDTPYGEPVVIVLYSRKPLKADFPFTGAVDFGEGVRYLGNSPEASREAAKRYSRGEQNDQ